MPVIPIDPSSIAGARPYNTPFTPIDTNICSAPKEGAKFIPMQFDFKTNPAWLVELTLSNSPARPFSQLASLYVDNTGSTHDVNIFFPDSGYTARIPFGDTAMLNVLTGKISPKFYVILDSSGNTNASDICNVFAINTFIPPFLISTFQRTVAYGYGQMFSLQPQFNQSQGFYFQPFYTVALAGITIIPHTQWYITYIFIQSYDLVMPADININITLFDNGVNFFNCCASSPLSAAGVSLDLCSLTGLNIISSGNGPLTAQLFFAGGPITNGYMNINIGGGVLVT